SAMGPLRLELAGARKSIAHRARDPGFGVSRKERPAEGIVGIDCLEQSRIGPLLGVLDVGRLSPGTKAQSNRARETRISVEQRLARLLAFFEAEARPEQGLGALRPDEKIESASQELRQWKLPRTPSMTRRHPSISTNMSILIGSEMF